jgi:hypothetical protein
MYAQCVQSTATRRNKQWPAAVPQQVRIFNINELSSVKVQGSPAVVLHQLHLLHASQHA